MIGWLRFQMNDASVWGYFLQALPISLIAGIVYAVVKYSLQGTTQGRYLTGGVPPVRFSM